MELPVPANALEFDDLYRDEETRLLTLSQAKWPDGLVCPRCGCEHGWELETRPVVECADCGHQASALAGTLLHAAELPLRVSFRLVSQLVAEKSGTHICALSRQMGVSHTVTHSGQAWRLCHRHGLLKGT